MYLCKKVLHKTHTWAQNILAFFHTNYNSSKWWRGTRRIWTFSNPERTNNSLIFLTGMVPRPFHFWIYHLLWYESHRHMEWEKWFTWSGTYNEQSGIISVEYPASLLRGWKTSPVTVNDNMIYQIHFLVVNFCSNKIF